VGDSVSDGCYSAGDGMVALRTVETTSELQPVSTTGVDPNSTGSPELEAGVVSALYHNLTQKRLSQNIPSAPLPRHVR